MTPSSQLVADLRRSANILFAVTCLGRREELLLQEAGGDEAILEQGPLLCHTWYVWCAINQLAALKNNSCYPILEARSKAVQRSRLIFTCLLNGLIWPRNSHTVTCTW